MSDFSPSNYADCCVSTVSDFSLTIESSAWDYNTTDANAALLQATTQITDSLQEISGECGLSRYGSGSAGGITAGVWVNGSAVTVKVAYPQLSIDLRPIIKRLRDNWHMEYYPTRQLDMRPLVESLVSNWQSPSDPQFADYASAMFSLLEDALESDNVNFTVYQSNVSDVVSQFYLPIRIDPEAEMDDGHIQIYVIEGGGILDPEIRIDLRHYSHSNYALWCRYRTGTVNKDLSEMALTEVFEQRYFQSSVSEPEYENVSFFPLPADLPDYLTSDPRPILDLYDIRDAMDALLEMELIVPCLDPYGDGLYTVRVQFGDTDEMFQMTWCYDEEMNPAVNHNAIFNLQCLSSYQSSYAGLYAEYEHTVDGQVIYFTDILSELFQVYSITKYDLDIFPSAFGAATRDTAVKTTRIPYTGTSISTTVGDLTVDLSYDITTVDLCEADPTGHGGPIFIGDTTYNCPRRISDEFPVDGDLEDHHPINSYTTEINYLIDGDVPAVVDGRLKWTHTTGKGIVLADYYYEDQYISRPAGYRATSFAEFHMRPLSYSSGNMLGMILRSDVEAIAYLAVIVRETAPVAASGFHQMAIEIWRIFNNDLEDEDSELLGSKSFQWLFPNDGILRVRINDYRDDLGTQFIRANVEPNYELDVFYPPGPASVSIESDDLLDNQMYWGFLHFSDAESDGWIDNFKLTAAHCELSEHAGGVIVGGKAMAQLVQQEFGSGGVVVSGSASVSQIFQPQTSGGVIVGIDEDRTMNGGCKVGGTAWVHVTEHYHEQMTGGVIIPALEARTLITVPAGAVASDLVQFPLMIRLMISGTNFRATTLTGKPLNLHVRQSGDGALFATVRIDLKSDEDNHLYLWSK